MKRLWRVICSLRTSVVLMLLLALLLLATVVVPQRAVVGGAVIDRLVARGAPQKFVIETLGLDAVATSPLFIAVLALFYGNLIAVLIDRLPPTIGKMRVRPPTAEALEQWVASPRAIEGTQGAGIDAGTIVAHLRGFGYRPQRVTTTSMYAVKHRYAAVGFLLFHASFFFLCAGGLLIWYTRFVGEMRVVEGQSVEAGNARVLRRPPAGEIPRLAFTLDRMTPSFDRGEATDLRASVRFGNAAPVEAWVNHPAERGSWSLLVNDVGIAPVLWLQDKRGFGIDRVAVPADRSTAVMVPLAAGVVRVEIPPRRRGDAFPAREMLATLPLDVVIREGEREVFRGALRPGEGAVIPGGRVVLTELRYWAGIKLISERGGALLIVGFALVTIGATWRLLLHRRDLVIAWSGRSFQLAGHGEWFADRDRRELLQIAATLERGHASRPAADGRTTEATG
jgi:hypothetical protein